MRGRDFLGAVKRAARPLQPTLSIAVGTPIVAVLRPVATVGTLNANDVRVLTAWRNRFVTSFLTEFEATEERTEQWLRTTVANDPTRVLFMLDTLEGTTAAYVGLAFIDWETGYGEADAVVRGADLPPGVMTAALHTLLAWAQNQLGLTALGVRVRSDNAALHFYEKVGFVERRRVPLRREHDGSMIRWVEEPGRHSEGLALVYMQLAR
jgi:RimJ/RimL family protein N-acetyltransferase